MIWVDDYIYALNDLGVADLADPKKLEFINLARNEITDAYPWPFRSAGQVGEFPGTTSITLTTPATTALETDDNYEFVKVKSVVNAYGQPLSPITQQEMASYGVTPENAADQMGTPTYYAVYTLQNTSGTHSTYVIPYPYGEISVVPLNPAYPVVAGQWDYYFPQAYKYLVVYGAAVHCYLLLGVADLAQSYRDRYADLMQSLINNQMQPTVDTPDIEYDAGA
jgi:hypothetical protein